MEVLLPNLRRRANRRLADELLRRTLLAQHQTGATPTLHTRLLLAGGRDHDPLDVAIGLSSTAEFQSHEPHAPARTPSPDPNSGFRQNPELCCMRGAAVRMRPVS